MANNNQIALRWLNTTVLFVACCAFCTGVASAQRPPNAKISSIFGEDSLRDVAGDDASPKSPAQDPPVKSKSPAQQTVGIITRKSVFFPELATNRTPLTSGQKFKLFVDKTISPSTFVGVVGSAALGQATNRYEGYGQGWDAYGKRVGAAFANSASTNFIGTFLVPSLLHQDPRHFFTERPGFGRKLEYAFSRQIVARKDDGHNTFNWSRILELLGSEAIANTYLPPDERTTERTFARAGIRFGIGIGTTLLKEYWPTIFKKLGMSHDSGGSSNQH